MNKKKVISLKARHIYFKSLSWSIIPNALIKSMKITCLYLFLLKSSNILRISTITSSSVNFED